MPDDDEPRRPDLGKTEPAEPVATPAPEPTAAADPDDGGATAAERDTPKRRAPLWLETVVLLVVALVMALVIKTFLVQAFYIPSASMEPGLVKNDRILVQKVSYWFGGSPSRGDVIVFEDPGGWLTGPEIGPTTLLSKGLAKVGLYPTGGHLVKRVIGVPGDTVVCCDADGLLEVNGVALDEDEFIAPQQDCDGPMPYGQRGCQRGWEVTVPDDRLFVMGDNRAASADSSARLCGPKEQGCAPDRPFVPLDNVVGKVFSLVWPMDHVRFVGRPDVFDSVPDAP
ncbi:signal peptidase I [Nocardioides dongxiaopingii]|uniref:signal peptidase I n=1 Tax=Nocardioides sp. S-1144 TaxID=2582905 RepID=UPI00110E18FA|nr:signal peptidase I [Nocardioides sp. S-1144]QCW51742.1 signal peptidase I [Nocardioides sp. S-1144]